MLKASNSGGSNEVVFRLTVEGNPANRSIIDNLKREVAGAASSIQQPWSVGRPPNGAPITGGYSNGAFHGANPSHTAPMPGARPGGSVRGMGLAELFPEHDIQASKQRSADSLKWAREYQEAVKGMARSSRDLEMSISHISTSIGAIARSATYLGLANSDSMQNVVHGLLAFEGAAMGVRGVSGVARGTAGAVRGLRGAAAAAGGITSVGVGAGALALGAGATAGLGTLAFAVGAGIGGTAGYYSMPEWMRGQLWEDVGLTDRRGDQASRGAANARQQLGFMKEEYEHLSRNRAFDQSVLGFSNSRLLRNGDMDSLNAARENALRYISEARIAMRPGMTGAERENNLHRIMFGVERLEEARLRSADRTTRTLRGEAEGEEFALGEYENQLSFERQRGARAGSRKQMGEALFSEMSPMRKKAVDAAAARFAQDPTSLNTFQLNALEPFLPEQVLKERSRRGAAQLGGGSLAGMLQAPVTQSEKDQAWLGGAIGDQRTVAEAARKKVENYQAEVNKEIDRMGEIWLNAMKAIKQSQDDAIKAVFFLRGAVPEGG